MDSAEGNALKGLDTGKVGLGDDSRARDHQKREEREGWARDLFTLLQILVI